MILIIGTNNCSNCNDVKNILNDSIIDYHYKTLKELTNEEKEEYFKLAKMSNQNTLPLIIYNEKLITLQEAIDAIKQENSR